MEHQKQMLINKIIERKNQDITWEEATKFVVSNENLNIIKLAEESKNVYLERLQQDQYIHSLS